MEWRARVQSFTLPSLASLSAFSFPSMLACARTLCKVVNCVRFCSISTIDVRIVLSGWFLCRDGCVIWVFKRYSTFMQSVKIWTGSWAYCVVIILSVLCIAIISARNMFCSPCSLLSILRSLPGL